MHNPTRLSHSLAVADTRIVSVEGRCAVSGCGLDDRAEGLDPARRSDPETVS